MLNNMLSEDLPMLWREFQLL